MLDDPGWIDEAPPCRAHRVGDRHSKFALMADGEGNAADAELLCACCSALMEQHRGLAGGKPFDFYLAPTYSADAEAEDLGDRLLRGPTTRQVLRARTNIGTLRESKHPLFEAPRVALQDASDARNSNDVDPDLWDCVRNIHEKILPPAQERLSCSGHLFDRSPHLLGVRAFGHHPQQWLGSRGAREETTTARLER